MTVERHQAQEENVGAYLLGALTDVELSAFERHMAECPICRDEVDRLRTAVDALPRSVPPLAPPPTLKASLMKVVEADVKDRAAAAAPASRTAAGGRFAWLGRSLGGMRPAMAGAGAAAVLVVGALAGYAATEISSDDGDGAQRLAARADKGRLPFASGSLVVPGEGKRGAILRVQGMPALERDSVYQVWLKRGDELISESLFSVSRDGAGTAAVPEDISSADAVLVTRERAGGASAPTEDPVLSVTL